MKITIEVPDDTVRIMVCEINENGYEREPRVLPLSAIIEVME